ncbi:hypothetical protein [Streptacidiphilus sp. EB129]|uniref:hypothetical protein n=1 Tax=Streptacidiphilus sp. EB129 TaxID=3156262 RepID=UPI003512FDED
MSFESELSALLDYEEITPMPLDTRRIMVRSRRRTRVRKAATGIAALAVAGAVAGFATGGFTRSGVQATQSGLVAPASQPPSADTSQAPLAAGSPSPVVPMVPGNRYLLLNTGYSTVLQSSGLCLEGPRGLHITCQELPPNPGMRPGLGYSLLGLAAPDHRAVLTGVYTGSAHPTRIVVTVGSQQVVATILTTPGEHNWVTYDAVIPQSSTAHATSVTAFDSTGHVIARSPRP